MIHGYIVFALNALMLLIFVDAILDNIILYTGKISPRHPVVKALHNTVEPILVPVRRVVPPLKTQSGYVDLSPMIAILLLTVILRIL